MATTYNGAIVPRFTLGAQKNPKMGTLCVADVKAGARPNIRAGVTTQDFLVVEFKRIPKDRVLNKFKNLGGNVKY